MNSCAAYNLWSGYKWVGDSSIESVSVYELPLVEISSVYLRYVKYSYLLF